MLNNLNNSMLTTLNTQSITTPMALQGARQTNNKEQDMSRELELIVDKIAEGMTYEQAKSAVDEILRGEM